MDAEVSTHTFLTMIAHIPDNDRTHSWQWLLRNLSVSCHVNQIFFCNYSYMVHTEYIYIFFFSSIEHCAWAIISPKEFKSCHAPFICITVLEHRIICCQIFCDLLLKSAFERIFNVMQLILVKIKWHIKWKYLIQKFHDICLSYYFNYLSISFRYKSLDMNNTLRC